ncbi:MAG: STAS domain-containing protein [Chloroflexota bacterium]
MGIRARLVFALLPILILALALTVIGLPLVENRLTAFAVQRQSILDQIVASQQQELLVADQHQAVSTLINGDSDKSYLQLRETLENTFSKMSQADSDMASSEQHIITLYDDLNLRHDTAVNLVSQGKRADARRLQEGETTQVFHDLLDAFAVAQEDYLQDLTAFDQAQREAIGNSFVWIVIGIGATVLAVCALTWWLLDAITQPIVRLADDAERYTTGNTQDRLSSGGNILQIRRLRNAFQQLLDTNAAHQQQIEAQIHDLEDHLSREQHFRETIQSLSVPIIPLSDKTLFLPLIGFLDETRCESIMETLLQKIYQAHAKKVVVDVTGIAHVTGHTAHQLQRIVAAVQLIGCRFVLVGVQAKHAHILAQTDLVQNDVAIAQNIPQALHAYQL